MKIGKSLPILLFPLLPWTASAVECMNTVKNTQEAIEQVKKNIDKVIKKKRSRIRAFLKDSEQILAKARKDRGKAESTFEKSIAKAKALVAQDNGAAAAFLIKVK